jgi:hypothetical protein
MDVRAKLKDLAISDSGFVFDPYTGATFSANATGRVILEGLRDGDGRQALLGRLAQSFDAGGQDLPRDLDDFVQTLRREGIVPMDFAVDSDEAPSTRWQEVPR